MSRITGRELSRNGSVALICVGTFCGMLGLSYASVPLYRIFCQVTGYGGTPQIAQDVLGPISDKSITVRFDANTSSGIDWDFGPAKRQVKIRLGEKGTAYYVAKNSSTTASWGTSTFNVTPQAAGQYFNKIECFCFTEQELKPGQSVDMPVVFFVDPEIVNDPLVGDLKAITLSYTFFPADPPERPLASVDESGNKKELKDNL
ncbi:MAG: cytochrome c oxidase assembly protein [Pseudomonadota bacterium]